MFCCMLNDRKIGDWRQHLAASARDKRRRPLARFIREAVAEQIRDGVIGKGERLVEEDLAVVFDVSRTPVREALRQLEVEGLVESVHNKGFVVADIFEDIDVVFNVRARVEGYAASVAARRAGADELEAIRDIQGDLTAAIKANDVAAAVDLNAAFHKAIVAAAHSARLQEIVDSLRTDYVSYQVVSMYDRAQLSATIAEHDEILDALWRRDARAAEVGIQSHIHKGHNAYLRYLEDPRRQEARETG
jgi:DNA-binding GntR family transcriptional regulator